MGNPSITPGQRKQIVRFMEDGLDALTLDKDGAQRIIEYGGDMQIELSDLLVELSVSTYFDREFICNYGYPEGYRIKRLTKQIRTLKQFFPELGSADRRASMKLLPSNAEGWFAIPRWEKLASTYGEAVDRVFKMIDCELAFVDYYDGQFGSKCLCQKEQTVKAFQKLGNEQKGHDILIVPCQFGLRYWGLSADKACEMMNDSEFCLDVFTIGCMFLTCFDKADLWENLYIICSGDELDLWGEGFPTSMLYFKFDGLELIFGQCDDNHYDPLDGHFGAASAFLRE